MKNIFIANWKMQLLPSEAAELAKKMAKELGGGIKDTEIVIAPAHDAIFEVSQALRGTKLILGAQDCFWEGKGAYTGEVSPLGLKELGCRYILVGHSERREKLHETDEMVAKKLRAVLAAGLTPVLCVGETKTQRENGETGAVLERELVSALSGVQLGAGGLVVAYEPVWAIGTGEPAELEDVKIEHEFIRKTLQKILPSEHRQARIIYGGSVNGENMAGFLAMPDVSGALVGGASLNLAEFKTIVTSK